MADSEGNLKVDGPRGASPDRKPYEKPAVAWEEQLEARPGLIAGCAKVSISEPICDQGGLAS
jgi:hypothetical protein